MNCTQCGEWNLADSRYCRRCGSPLTADIPGETGTKMISQKAQSNQKPPVWFLILNLLSGLFWVLIALIFSLFGRSAQLSATPYYVLAGLTGFLGILHLVAAVRLRRPAKTGVYALEVAAILLLFLFPFGTALSFALFSYRFGKKSAGRGGILVLISIFSFLTYAETFYMISNLQPGIGRGFQKRTMADMRAVGTAVEGYAVETNQYPAVRTIRDLTPFVEPKYIKKLPLQDAWQNDFTYVSDGLSYTICSAGKDRTGCKDFSYQGPTNSFDNDIVFSQGEFLVYPEGAQY